MLQARPSSNIRMMKPPETASSSSFEICMVLQQEIVNSRPVFVMEYCFAHDADVGCKISSSDITFLVSDQAAGTKISNRLQWMIGV